MDSKTLSTILGHYSVSFTLDTYAHVLDTHKRDGIQLMEELFAPRICKNTVYPIVISSGFDNKVTLTAVDFDNISIVADSINDGLNFIREKISNSVNHGFSPMPTPYEQIQVGTNEMIMMVSI